MPGRLPRQPGRRHRPGHRRRADPGTHPADPGRRGPDPAPAGPVRPARRPRDFAEAGWYAGGTAPGDVGPAVLAGHVDSATGPAVFARLSELRPGDRIEVRRGGRWLGFRVSGAGRHAKDAFPTDAVYRPTPGPELRLITCAGAFDRSTRHYRDNLVVYAVADRPAVIPVPAAGRNPGVRAGPVGSDGAPA
ncbi:sortase domain-containing protein [Plantactinospora veratri]